MIDYCALLSLVIVVRS